MATSNSYDFSATRSQIIRQAALDVGAISAGVTAAAELTSDFSFRLNAMVKRWSAAGIHVWTTQEATLFPQASQVSYTLSSTSSDHATQSYVSTQLASAAADGASSITVDSISGISNGDYIGIVVDDGTLHWTTVNGTPSGSTVTLTDALDDSAAVDNRVYAYTTKIVRPLKIVDARRYDVSAARDIPMNMIARLDYQKLPNKTATGTITEAFYDPQLSAGILKIWYAPAVVTDLINFTWHRPIMDFDAAADNPDLPQEWISALISNLAYEMRNQYGVVGARAAELRNSAAQTLDDVIGFDREEGSVFFQPDIGYE